MEIYYIFVIQNAHFCEAKGCFFFAKLKQFINCESDKDSAQLKADWAMKVPNCVQTYPLSDLVAGNKYRFCYIEQNNIEYEHKFYEGDNIETLRIDARMNGIISVPLTRIVKIVAL